MFQKLFLTIMILVTNEHTSFCFIAFLPGNVTSEKRQSISICFCPDVLIFYSSHKYFTK